MHSENWSVSGRKEGRRIIAAAFFRFGAGALSESNGPGTGIRARFRKRSTSVDFRTRPKFGDDCRRSASRRQLRFVVGASWWYCCASAAVLSFIFTENVFALCRVLSDIFHGSRGECCKVRMTRTRRIKNGNLIDKRSDKSADWFKTPRKISADGLALPRRHSREICSFAKPTSFSCDRPGDGLRFFFTAHFRPKHRYPRLSAEKIYRGICIFCLAALFDV